MPSSPSNPDPLDPGPAGFAHRGLHGSNIPENSLAAFQAALDAGAGIECDVRLSADGVPVVFHDPDLKRLVGIEGSLASLNAEELSAMRLAGTREAIPTVTELLDLIDERVPILIELKTFRGNAARLARAVGDSLAYYGGPVGVMSFDPRVGRWFATNLPYRMRGLVIRGDWSAARRKLAMTVADPKFVAVDRAAVHRSWVAQTRRRMPVYSWTIRDAEQRAQADVHADALIWEADGRPRI